ncbi:hypothetical protein Q4602_21555 [Paraglaciecola chathamensis]|uniref:hypothetical protein n=1 Tax=Paraglaciecola chathamensis TaxID=368405 RepID=UPI00270E4B18|nr:hypothetical protein [Paraglaciecola chathamensis]MDO6842072.1 hypothetical protein [Paraglaciecola chathamensis]
MRHKARLLFIYCCFIVCSGCASTNISNRAGDVIEGTLESYENRQKTENMGLNIKTNDNIDAIDFASGLLNAIFQEVATLF